MRAHDKIERLRLGLSGRGVRQEVRCVKIFRGRDWELAAWLIDCQAPGASRAVRCFKYVFSLHLSRPSDRSEGAWREESRECFLGSQKPEIGIELGITKNDAELTHTCF